MKATRPCRPGDILWELNSRGVQAEIRVAKPEPHPRSGTTEDREIRLTLVVGIPSRQAEGPIADVYILNAYIDHGIKCMGNVLHSGWGSAGAGPWKGYRTISKHATGNCVAETLSRLVKAGTEAVEAAGAVYDAHYRSRERQEEARAAAYAAYPVPDRCAND